MDKSRDEVVAEREAKKAAKRARRNKDADVVDRGVFAAPASAPAPESAQIKSKSELRAERRAKQDAQRAAKQQDPPPVQIPAPVTEKKVKRVQKKQHKVKLFDHLYAERERPTAPPNSEEIHPAIVRLGVKYASHAVIGSNARCVALLDALKEVIRDYSLPSNVEFARGLEAHLGPCLKYLYARRRPAVSMNNAARHVRWQLGQLPNDVSEHEGKSRLCEAIDVYVRDQIEMAGKAISMTVKRKIADGDVVLTYGRSSLIERILTDAAAERKFRVVAVEARPRNEGKETIRRLTASGIDCSAVTIAGLSFVMREVDKVILGAGALLANGYVTARAGTAQVALVARAFNVPVLVCCETHKFSERVQTDSFVCNEIGDPEELIRRGDSADDGPLSDWREYGAFSPLNLFYDVTPPDLVAAVVTELAVLPCTSVPVILRMKPSEFA